MVMDIPYNFVGGNTAKAKEVNENFNAVKQYVNNIEVNLAEAEQTIFNMRDTKANINGSPNQPFEVATGLKDNSAVNNKDLLAKIDPTLETIRGLKLTKVADTTISLSEGSCYDIQLTHILLSKQTLNYTLTQDELQRQIVNLYIVGNDTIGDTKLHSGLPTGYPYYRYVGYAVVADNKITQVVTYNASATGGFIGDTMFTAVPGTVTLGQNRWLYIQGNADDSLIEVKINDVTIAKQKGIASQLIPCKLNQVINISKEGNVTLQWKAMV